MLTEIKFFFYAIKKNIQNSAELRGSFLANIVGMAINNVAFIILWGFFVKSVGVINGWTVADIIGLLGFTAICYGIVFSVGYGIRKLPEYVANGNFDRFMLSPKNLLIRIATSSFNVAALGDVVFGVACLVIYGVLINANLFQYLLIIILTLAISILFLGVTILIFSLSFLFMDAQSATGGIFELFFTPSLFNGGIFQGAMRFIFTFIVPSLVIGALPVEAVKNISPEKIFLIIILSVFWLVLSVYVFNRCVRKYESSNFMTFGN
jgi:ABC-2 type transport system permease protein